MADGRDNHTDSVVNILSATLIGQENLGGNEKNKYKCAEHNLNVDNSLPEWTDLENENNSELHCDFNVGGVTCDNEDKGCTELDVNDSTKFLPRLVFLDSDENVTRNKSESLLSNPASNYYREERSASDTTDVKSHSLRIEKSHLNQPSRNGYLVDESVNPLLQSQSSHISQISSDSDLIRDHTMPSEQELAEVGGENYEQFLMEQTENNIHLDEWHCHTKTAKVPEDKTARNQLIAVSVLCFLFMVGEAIGN